MIREARSPTEIESVRRLLKEYEADIGVDLCFQSFSAELDALPGEYAPPLGRLFVAEVDGELVGCVALRPIDKRRAEMKRLYLKPGQRGSGLGRLLAETAIREARMIGYEEIVLDTLQSMERAISLYQSLGFEPIAAYRHNPVCGTVCFRLQLRSTQ